MFRPARMVHLNVLVLDSDVDRATTEMIRSELVHLVGVADVEPWADEAGLDVVAEPGSESLAELEKKAITIADAMGVGRQIVRTGLAFEPLEIDQAREKLQQIEREVEPLVSARDAARGKLDDLREARSRFAVDIGKKFGIDLPARYTLLEVALGHVLQTNLGTFKRLLSEVPNVVLTFPEGTTKVAALAIVLKRDRAVLQRALEQVGFEHTPAGEGKAPPSDITAELDQRIAAAGEELEKAEAAVGQCRDEHLTTLRTILSKLALQSVKRQAKNRYRKTARTYLISGWTPKRQQEKVVRALKEACDNRCLAEVEDAEEILQEREGKVDVPILFQNPKLLKPFQMLVSNYGTPAYNSIDPTVAMAPTFLLMFGLMFGDVGQGLVVAVLGALVARWKRVSEGVRTVAELFVWCGIAAALLGLIYGTLFGFRLYQGLEPLQNVTGFMNFALFFGIGLLSLGLIFNVVSAATKKDWLTGLLNRTGLMGLAFYWVAVAVSARFLSGGRVSGSLLGLLILLPVVAVLLKGPLEKVLHPRRRAFQKGVAGYLLSSFGEIVGTYFESLMTLLSNTISFLRVAAFAMAHAALFAAVFSLAETVKGAGPGLPIVVHILGNAVIIALEGLVVCVQAVRLHYYEFFGKFYQAGGTEFRPMRLPATVH